MSTPGSLTWFAAHETRLAWREVSAMLSGAKGPLEALAQEAGALLATTLLGKGLFDGNPFALDIAGTFATDLGRELFAECDLVIAGGAGLAGSAPRGAA